jgi:hypothetical protein
MGVDGCVCVCVRACVHAWNRRRPNARGCCRDSLLTTCCADAVLVVKVAIPTIQQRAIMVTSCRPLLRRLFRVQWRPGSIVVRLFTVSRGKEEGREREKETDDSAVETQVVGEPLNRCLRSDLAKMEARSAAC